MCRNVVRTFSAIEHRDDFIARLTFVFEGLIRNYAACLLNIFLFNYETRGKEKLYVNLLHLRVLILFYFRSLFTIL